MERDRVCLCRVMMMPDDDENAAWSQGPTGGRAWRKRRLRKREPAAALSDFLLAAGRVRALSQPLSTSFFPPPCAGPPPPSSPGRPGRPRGGVSDRERERSEAKRAPSFFCAPPRAGGAGAASSAAQAPRPHAPHHPALASPASLDLRPCARRDVVMITARTARRESNGAASNSRFLSPLLFPAASAASAVAGPRCWAAGSTR